MTVAKKKISPRGEDKQKKKKWRGALLALLLIAAVIAAVLFAVFGAAKLLFTANPRFQLRETRVSGPGYWKEHPEELARRIKLKKGVNLFALDLRAVRKQIREIPNVDNCSVMRVLPDTLVINIVERVPRAILGRARSPWLVDGNAVVIPRSQFGKQLGHLPVIKDVKLTGAQAGKTFKKVKQAVDLVMTTVHSFPDFQIHSISLRDPEKMLIYLRYRNFPIYQVTLPVKNRGLSFSLIALQSAIINARERGETRIHYDLSYDNKVVIN